MHELTSDIMAHYYDMWNTIVTAKVFLLCYDLCIDVCNKQSFGIKCLSNLL